MPLMAGESVVCDRSEQIFSVTKQIFSVSEKIFSSTKMILSSRKKIFSLAKKIFSVMETIFSRTLIIFQGAEMIFPVTKKIVTVPSIIICAIERTVWLMDFRWTCIVRDPAYVQIWVDMKSKVLRPSLVTSHGVLFNFDCL